MSVTSSASETWLASHGSGTYGPRVTGRSLAKRRTRPIRLEYFERTIGRNRCLRCVAHLVFRKTHRGGAFYACAALGTECYYIGFDRGIGSGHETLPSGS